MSFTLEVTSLLTQVLLVSVLVLLLVWTRKRKSVWKESRDQRPLPDPPSPLSLPLIGHLHLLAPYGENPWLGFNSIRQKYGDLVSLRLGVYPTLLVSSLEAVREVLLTKGDVFADRPHFERHAIIFGSDRQNALALCDWTENHKTRRAMAHAGAIPRFGTKCFERMSFYIENGVRRLIKKFDAGLKDGFVTVHKEAIVNHCGNIFAGFLLETNIDDHDVGFQKVNRQYDLVFREINIMYIYDFLPYLKNILAWKQLKQLEQNAFDLRVYIEGLVRPRLQELKQTMRLEKEGAKNGQAAQEVPLGSAEEERLFEERFVDRILLQKQYQSDAKFVDFVLKHYLENKGSMTWEECLFEVGDLVGGSSAVANLLARMLAQLTLHPAVQQQLYEEAVSTVANRDSVAVSLEDQPAMPLTVAAIMESLRLCSSPIVPHLARTDTSVQGYFVPKGTMVLFNTYHLNFTADYWKDPYAFDPSRFVSTDGSVRKPEYFFPFSFGRRSCLGYKLVYSVLFLTAANLLLRFRLVPSGAENTRRMKDLMQPKCTLALPLSEDCFHFRLVPRSSPFNSQL